MSAQFVTCECGVRLKVPPEMAKARSVKCPKCASPVDLSGLTWPASDAPAPTLPPARATARPSVAAAMLDEAIGEPTTKDCIYCGEKVMASAIKCRHCGEFFDTSKVPSRAGSPAAAAKVKPGDEPNPAEYFVALLMAPIGLIIGLIWMAQKQPKGKGMIKASVLSLTIVAVAGLMAKIYIFAPETGPSAPPMPPGGVPQYVFVQPDGEQASPNRGNNSGGPGDLPGGVDLEGQPAPIQKAMRANVKIEGTRSMGSGVVIQRVGDGVLILTNHHVITESNDLNEKRDVKSFPRLRVTYFNEQSIPGTVVWVAPDGIDLAIVKSTFAPKEIEPVVWSVTAKVLAGQEVFAVGNPINLGWSLSKGVVSAFRQQKHGPRDIGIIQSDTKTTFGNSGGGLYNAIGELIGINTAIADPRLGSGLGFSIRPQVLIDLKPEGLSLPEGSSLPESPKP